MPKILDVVFASLCENSNSQNSLFNQETVFSSSNTDQFNAEGLSFTPLELANEFEEEFSSYFAHTIVKDEGIFLSTTVFFKKEFNNETDIDSILKEHSYCAKK